MSSNQALQRVKKCLRAKKAGHTGSLDPLATGLLPICFGQATKLSEFLLGSDKTYEVTARLGITTDSYDADGKVLSSQEVTVETAAIETALEKFRGDILQVPPMVSALKHNGQPLYKLARKGVEVVRAPRKMSVFSLHMERLEKTLLRIRVHCSSGFYVRSLVHDLGQLLGCGAHVESLRRTAIGSIDLQSSVTLDEIERVAANGSSAIRSKAPECTAPECTAPECTGPECSDAECTGPESSAPECTDADHFLQPLDVLVNSFTKVYLEDSDCRRLLSGQGVQLQTPREAENVAFYQANEQANDQGNSKLVAVGNVLADGTIKARKRIIYTE